MLPASVFKFNVVATVYPAFFSRLGSKILLLLSFTLLAAWHNAKAQYKQQTYCNPINIYYGIDPKKLYTCIMVHDFNEYWLKTMDNQKQYYFTIEAVNENGVSQKSSILKAH